MTEEESDVTNGQTESPQKLPVESVLKKKKDSSGDLASSAGDGAASRHVKFQPDEKDSSDAKPRDSITRSRPKGSSRHSRSAFVGKADPKRDMIVLVSIAAILFMMSNGFSSIGHEFAANQDEEFVTESTQRRPASLSQMKEALGKVLELKQRDWEKRYPVREGCSAFLAASTIPEAGFGIYAGKTFEEGDIIMDLTGTPFWAIPGSDDMSGSILWASPQALFLMKHHPTLSNVEPSSSLFASSTVSPTPDEANPLLLRATRTIEEGEEILLNYASHPHAAMAHMTSFRRTTPTAEDYEEANDLIQYTRSTFRGFNERNRALGVNSNKMASVIGQALRVVQNIAERYQPTVGALLPTTLETLSSYRGRTDQVTSLYFSLQNRTSIWLSRHGSCVTDLKASANHGPTLTIPVPKGRRAHPMPVQLRTREQGECLNEGNTDEPQDSEVPEKAREAPSGKWCLPVPSNMLFTNETAASMEFCLLEPQAFEVASDPLQVPNVELVWSDSTQAPDWHASRLMVDPKSYRDVYLWDLVALRDLEVGETLVLSLNQSSTTSGEMVLPDSLVIPVDY